MSIFRQAFDAIWISNIVSLFVWSIAFGFILGPLQIFFLSLHHRFREIFSSVEEDTLRSFQMRVLEFEGMLQSGNLPTEDQWSGWRDFPDPWGRVSDHLFKGLRSAGAEVLPTLERLRETATSHLKLVQQSRARSAQAQMQSWVGLILVPIFSWTLWRALPGLEAVPGLWWGCSAGAVFWSFLGTIQIHQLALRLQWMGLSRDRRSWIVGFRLLGESLLAQIRSGRTPDEVWAQVAQTATEWSPLWSEVWATSLWNRSVRKVYPKRESNTVGVIRKTAEAIRESLVVGLMEGRPVLPRVQSQLDTFSHEISALVEADLQTLPNRALKPLFIFIAPSLLFLLGLGLLLSSSEMMDGF